MPRVALVAVMTDACGNEICVPWILPTAPVPPSVNAVVAPPMFRVVTFVLNTVPVVLREVVMSPPLTAISPEVVMLPVAPATEKVAPVILFKPKDNALTISGSDRSSAFVIPPASDLILIPENIGSSVSRFSTNTICPAGDGLDPSANANCEKPADPAEVVALKLAFVSVNSISLPVDVVIKLPASYEA